MDTDTVIDADTLTDASTPDTLRITRNWHQIHLQAHVSIHVQVPQFPEPYMIHEIPRDISIVATGSSVVACGVS